MPKHLPLLVAIAGLVLTALHLWDLIESLEVLVSAGVMGARESGVSLDPTMMGKLVGEAIITVICRSIWIPIPAAVLYLAWVPLRYRPRWFRMVMVAVSIFFLQQIPIGTICGIVLLLTMRRHRVA